MYSSSRKGKKSVKEAVKKRCIRHLFFIANLTFSSNRRGNLRLQLLETSTANYINYIKSGVVENQKTLIYNLNNKKNVVTIIFTTNCF